MLKKPELFFASVRQGILGPTLSAEEVSGCEAILKAMEGAPLADAAYALGTAFHETASTMQPICERGGPSYFFRMYDIAGARPKVATTLGNLCSGDGCTFHGRGYVQLTGRTNYTKASKVCGVDLVAAPDKAMDPLVAAKIMRNGMDSGWFTGRGFRAYLPKSGIASRQQFTDARRIINGSDCAAKIAQHALDFQIALSAGGWT